MDNNKVNVKDALRVDKNAKKAAIGGQAVIEGVMMRGKKMYAMAVRKPDNEIEIITKDLSSGIRKNPLLKLPIIRGIVAFIDSLVIGMGITMQSAEIAGVDDTENEEPSKFELYLTNKFGDKLTQYIVYLSVAISLIISISLFMILPVWLGSLLTKLANFDNKWIGVIEGIVRMIIFIGYLYLISKNKDIQRVFKYHGAEHKTIACFEHNEELTVVNVKKYTRLHKRCGTSFLLIVMALSMLIFFFVRTDSIYFRMLSRIILIPFIAGISYEIIRIAGKSDSTLVNIISYPGLMLQKLTTNEPDDDQIEVAIAAVNTVLEMEKGEH